MAMITSTKHKNKRASVVGALFGFIQSSLLYLLRLYSMSLFRKMERREETAIESGKTKVKPSRLLFACMHYRAHPRHYRAEYVRGYLHRKRCV